MKQYERHDLIGSYEPWNKPEIPVKEVDEKVFSLAEIALAITLGKKAVATVRRNKTWRVG